MNHFERFESYIPIDLNEINNFILATLIIYLFVVGRYFLMVIPVHRFFLNKESNIRNEKLSQISKTQIRSEIYYSIISSCIFAVSGTLLGWLWQNGHTQIYLPFNQYNFIYFPISFILLSVVHELYFYSTHRLMHHKKLFKIIHQVHHDSKNVSPFASFSFHPYEAIITAGFLPLVVMLIPLHPLTLITYLVFMTVTAISNHLGHEIFGNHKILNHFISGKHHQLHHTYYNKNYGLYFCFLDKLLGTEKLEKNK